MQDEQEQKEGQAPPEAGKRQAPGPRDWMYSKIGVSLRTMDIVIAVLVAALVICFIVALR